MDPVRLDVQGVGVALARQFVVHEHTVVGPMHVRQQPSVMITSDDVSGEQHPGSLREDLGREQSCRVGVALRGATGLRARDLGRVDPE